LLVFRFDIEDKPHVLRFADELMTVLINGRPVNVQFGGDPIPIIVRGKKHFIRLTELPRGIRPGYVKIYSMEIGQLSRPVLPVIGKYLFSANLGIHIMLLLWYYS
jgi:hypothetical protein